MGTDIHGWVEVNQSAAPSNWQGIIRITWLIQRNYPMFGSLFGIRNLYAFRPLAAERGFPPDVSNGVLEDAQNMGAVGITWLAYTEVQQIDWEEYGQPIIMKATGMLPEAHRRKECVTDDWDLLFAMMRMLAARAGDEQVRLIAWFDQY